jgi:hypothetical protein
LGTLLKKIIVCGAILFLLIQVYRPDRTNPPVVPAHQLEALMSIPHNVDAILTRSCGDCHSNETHWPWYTNVSPMSWLVASHVQGGRSHMNFSEWDALKARPGLEKERLQGICNEMQSGDMPLSSYLWIHWNAEVSSDDIRVVCEWTALQVQQMQTGSNPQVSTNPK